MIFKTYLVCGKCQTKIDKMIHVMTKPIVYVTAAETCLVRCQNLFHVRIYSLWIGLNFWYLRWRQKEWASTRKHIIFQQTELNLTMKFSVISDFNCYKHDWQYSCRTNSSSEQAEKIENCSDDVRPFYNTITHEFSTDKICKFMLRGYLCFESE